MECNICGSRIDGGGAYCPTCGAMLGPLRTEIPEQAATLRYDDPRLEQTRQPGTVTYTGQPAYGVPVSSERKKFPARTFIAAAAILVLLAAVGFGGYAWYRSNQYNKASDAFSAGNYQEAYDGFDKLGDYKDSAARRDESAVWLSYEAAIDKFEDGDYIEAREAFYDLNGFEDSQYYIDLCENWIAYEEAQAYYDNEEYQKAYNAFKNLGGFEDSDSKAASCIQPDPADGLVEQGEAYAASTDGTGLRIVSYRTFDIYFQFYTSSGSYWGSMWLSAYGDATINIPAGTYTVKGYTGSDWFGPKDLFGNDEEVYDMTFTDGSRYWVIPAGQILGLQYGTAY